MNKLSMNASPSVLRWYGAITDRLINEIKYTLISVLSALDNEHTDTDLWFP